MRTPGHCVHERALDRITRALALCLPPCALCLPPCACHPVPCALRRRVRVGGVWARSAADCSVRVAFTRWVEGRDNAFLDINAFVMHPGIQQVMQAPLMHPPAQGQALRPGGGGEGHVGASGLRAASGPRCLLGRGDLGCSIDAVWARDVLPAQSQWLRLGCVWQCAVGRACRFCRG